MNKWEKWIIWGEGEMPTLGENWPEVPNVEMYEERENH
jgi:hypothetical protein